MARALWKGAINFGLVHIPVGMWKATRPQDIHFRLLHEKDMAPLEQKRVCSVDGKEVPYKNVIKGYEVAKGEFVPIDPEELEALEPDNPHSIDIEDFVCLEDVDPIYYETAYYLSPEKGAAKPYSLLVAAMEKSDRAAIARFVMRTKQHLVIMRAMEGHAIGISTLFYADEVVSLEDVPGIPKTVNPSKQELEMAVRLIDSMSTDFQPDKYEDTYREKIVEMLEKKAKGKKLSMPKHKETPAKVIDLVNALQASLGEKPQKSEKSEKPAKDKSTKKSSGKKSGKSGKKKSVA